MNVYVGVDGGGTHTRAIALSAGGRPCGEGRAGPSNWQAVGPARAVEAVRDAVAQAAGDARLLGVGACLAGIDLPEDPDRLRGPLEQALGCSVVLENDIAAALFAANDEEVGVVSSGSGTAVALRQGTRVRRLLAVNRYTGPGGGAKDIAEASVRAAILAAQGAAPETMLAAAIMEAFALPDHVALARATQDERIPHWQVALVVAPLAARLAAAGDAVAGRILRDCGRELGEAAGRFFRSEGLLEDAPVDLHGSVLRGGPRPYVEAFRRALRRYVRGPVRPGEQTALEGAGRFALRAFGAGRPVRPDGTAEPW